MQVQKLVPVLLVLFCIVGIVNVFALSDEKYKSMLETSEEFAQAESRLNTAWKALRKVAPPGDMEKYLDDQRQWLKFRDTWVLQAVANPAQAMVFEFYYMETIDEIKSYTKITDMRAKALENLVFMVEKMNYYPPYEPVREDLFGEYMLPPDGYGVGSVTIAPSIAGLYPYPYLVSIGTCEATAAYWICDYTDMAYLRNTTLYINFESGDCPIRIAINDNDTIEVLDNCSSFCGLNGSITGVFAKQANNNTKILTEEVNVDIKKYRENLNEIIAFSNEMQSLSVLLYFTDAPSYLVERFHQDIDELAKALANYSKLVDAYEKNPSEKNAAKMKKALPNLETLVAKLINTMINIDRWL